MYTLESGIVVGIITLVVLWVAGYVVYRQSVETSIGLINKSANNLVSAANRSFREVSQDIKTLNGQAAKAQSEAKKLHDEIATNGVVRDIRRLETKVYGSDIESRLNALEKHLKIELVTKFKKVEIPDGLHYEKISNKVPF